ncbi:sensor histidine kinase [Jingyaoa shaoxingensis]|uniref:histidine kinase n=1 Tax=Jingyaoa shaoxingensis TaxID=2763671 RepID=A0ABR7N8J1_9FIRM|nr:sensor histidine kinase [Jingyaoa shaoxingensis]MBC8572709.1 sensor histidine kinase [Jingyaoa shaoxingensis]
MRYLNEKWKKLQRRVGNRSFRFMISMSFTFVALTGMILITAVLLNRYERTLERQVLSDSQKLIGQVEINLNTYLRSMMRSSDAVYYNVIKKVDFDKDDISRELSLLYEANKDNLVSIACFTRDGELLGAAPVGSLKKNVNITAQSWFEDASDKMENLHFSDLHVQNIFENKSGRYYWVVSLSRGVELTNDGKMSGGILLVDMNFSGIQQLFTEVNNDGKGYVYLIGRDGEIIYHPRQNLIFSNIIQENNQTASTYDEGVHNEEFQGEQRVVVVKTVGYTGWKIVSVVSKESLFSDLNQTRMMALLNLVLAIFLMIFVNQYVAVRITDPLKKLEKSIQGIEMKQQPVVYIGGPPEIQHLGLTIRFMVEELQELTDKMVKEQEEKRKNELDALQSQINPHFLYNTLDSIMWMIESERYEDAVSMVQALGRLLRISLSRGKNVISVGDELQHARSYLAIQRYRYKNKFTSYFEVEPDIEQYKTIKLVIQPLIENAIYYGMEYMDGEGEIHIRAYTREQDLYLEVEDNGPGMPEEQVEHLLTGGEKARQKGSGIGLKNVNQRIQLYFGTQYGLEIESEPDEGTVVRIHIPKTTEEEAGEQR